MRVQKLLEELGHIHMLGLQGLLKFPLVRLLAHCMLALTWSLQQTQTTAPQTQLFWFMTSIVCFPQKFHVTNVQSLSAPIVATIHTAHVCNNESIAIANEVSGGSPSTPGAYIYSYAVTNIYVYRN